LVVPRKIYVAVDGQYAIVYAFVAAHSFVRSTLSARPPAFRGSRGR